GESLLIFESSVVGYIAAMRLNKYFEDQGMDRNVRGNYLIWFNPYFLLHAFMATWQSKETCLPWKSILKAWVQTGTLHLSSAGEDAADAVKVTLGEHVDYGYPLHVQKVCLTSLVKKTLIADNKSSCGKWSKSLEQRTDAMGRAANALDQWADEYLRKADTYSWRAEASV
nr:probable 6-phosphogluconolactonase 4, chloroplastic [Tanacetum cinerariifolium]